MLLVCVECGDGGGRELERVMLSILMGSITGLGCGVVTAFLVRIIFRYINKRPPLVVAPVVFSPQISPKSLQSALANQTLITISNTYYKAVLDEDGITVAVKTFDVGSKNRLRLQNELEKLSGLRHRNLMSLRAYVSEAGSCCIRLVYDYVPTGSLEDYLIKVNEENQVVIMGWDVRLRIAIGIIKGLQYLHFRRILHYNLKPSNILLDADFEPMLGDCGLAKLTTGISNSSCCCSSSYYYPPPECFSIYTYTEKSDIFSFGVILGILLTGRGRGDRGGVGGMGIWFRQLIETGDGRDALDKTLLGEQTEEEEEEALMLLRIAAVCLSDMPADRPSTDELVPMLTQLRHSF